MFAAVLVAAVMAEAVVGAQGWQEGYSALAFVAGMAFFGFGMFSSLVAAGTYVGVLRSNHPFQAKRAPPLGEVQRPKDSTDDCVNG